MVINPVAFRFIIRLICAILALIAVVLVVQAITTPAKSMVIIEWSTASELDTVGFNLYRSDSPEGSFIPVNDRLIPASIDQLSGGSYIFTDTNVTAWSTYYYNLEDMESGGGATTHGPIKASASGGRLSALLMAAVLMVGAIGGIVLTYGKQKTDES